MTKLKPRPFKFLQYHWRTTRFGPSTPLLTNHRTENMSIVMSLVEGSLDGYAMVIGPYN